MGQGFTEMYKRFWAAILICIIALLAMSVPVFASGSDSPGAYVYDRNTTPTEQYYVTITRPDGNENTFKKTYLICGKTDRDDISIKVLIFNKDRGRYEDFRNIDGDAGWEIGSSGIFMKEFQLSPGANRLRIVAYKTASDEKVQISDYTITVLEESIKDKIINSAWRITRFFDQLLPK